MTPLESRNSSEASLPGPVGHPRWKMHTGEVRVRMHLVCCLRFDLLGLLELALCYPNMMRRPLTTRSVWGSHGF